MTYPNVSTPIITPVKAAAPGNLQQFTVQTGSWRDQLQEASFRGVPFKVSSHDTSAGRRTALHEFPLRDTPYVEDLGRSTRRLTVEGFLIGDDCLDQMGQMLAAVESPGPGKLVHPVYGALTVSVIADTSFTHVFKEGRIVRFRFEAIPTADKALRPQEDLDIVTQVYEYALQVQANCIRRVPIGQTGLNLFDLLSGLEELALAVRALFRAVLRNLKALIKSGFGLSWIASGLAAVMDTIKGIDREIAGAITNIESLLFEIKDTWNDLGDIFSGRKKLALVEACLNWGAAFGDDLPPITGNSTVAQQAAANQAVLVSTIRTIAVCEACRAAVNVEYDNADEAGATMLRLGDVLDLIARDAADTQDDDRYRELTQLRALTIRAMISLGSTLADRDRITLKSGVNSTLVLAYDQYDDLSREQDVIDRNQAIKHPGFLPIGQPLEILSK